MSMETAGSLSDEAARQELYSLLHQSLPRKQALERVLEIGTLYLGVEHGHITDIDEDDGRWEVISSSDPSSGRYPAGLTADLEETYCRRTIGQAGPVALHEAGAQGWADDPAYRRHRLDTYVGRRIIVFGEPFGTVCFVDEEARPTPFSEAERVFVELAGEVLRQVLEQSHQQQQLANRDRLISVLNRVLRHNLRNDLNVVHGYAEMLEERSTGEMATWAAAIEEASTGLLGLAEQARRLEQLTRNVPVARPMDVVPVVADAVLEIRRQYPAANVTFEAPDEAVALAAPQLGEAVAELLANAADVGGEAPTMGVEIERTADTTRVAIEDDGPGLPAHEQRILVRGDETQLEHGSGLGLVLVYWIVSNLDADITVDASGHGTRIEIDLDRPASHTSAADLSRA